MAEIGTGRVEANGITFHYLEMGHGPLVLCLHGFGPCPHLRGACQSWPRRGFHAVALLCVAAPHLPSPGWALSIGVAGTRRPGADRGPGASGPGWWGMTGGRRPSMGQPYWHQNESSASSPLVQPIRLRPGAIWPCATTASKASGMPFSFRCPLPNRRLPPTTLLSSRAGGEMRHQNSRRPGDDGAPRATFRQPGVVTAALCYYRHTFHPDNRDPHLQISRSASAMILSLCRHWPSTARKIGQADSACRSHGSSVFTGSREGDLPGTGHFVHLERPQEVNAQMVAFLSAT